MLDQKVESLRKTLKAMGNDDDFIEKAVTTLIETEREEEKLRKEEEEKVFTSKEAAEYLKKALDGAWDDQKVRKLAREGKLQTIGDTAGQRVQRKGHRFHVDVLDAYIARAKMSREDLEKRLDELEKENAELKATIHELKNADSASKEEQSESEGTNLSPKQEKRKNDPITAVTGTDEFDFDRANIRYQQKPKEIGPNRYEVKFQLNAERFTCTIAKTGETLSILGAESLIRPFSINLSSHGDYLETLEKALIPKIEKHFK